ncbi:MAG: carbohydrate ABC transporter permease [Sporolactobacillus sp.]
MNRQLQVENRKQSHTPKILKLSVRTLIYVILIIWAGFTMIPIIWMISSSFKDTTDIMSVPPQFIPLKPTINAYIRLFTQGNMARWMLNSLIVASIVTVTNVFFASLAGYAFAKLRFPGQHTIFWVLLATMMIPGQVTLIPLYVLVVNILNLENTYIGLIIPMIADVGSIFLMKQYMSSLPASLIDSARIDGCNEFRIFWKIILPLAKPGLAVLAIFTFVAQWNSFFWPLLITNTDSMRTVQVGLSMFRFQFNQDYGAMMAGATCSALPMIILFFALQKYFLRGITVGAIKG